MDGIVDNAPAEEVVDTGSVVETGDMYFDTDSFDFSSLDDVVESDNELGYNTKQTGADLMDAEELEDLKGSEGFDEAEDGEEGTDEADEESDEEDEDESESDESTEESAEEGTDESDGDEEVDFESYELTLPNGDTVVLNDLVNGYRNKAELEAERQEFDTMKSDFDKQMSGIKNRLELSLLEADKVIADYEDFDWASYRDENPVGYVENREFLDRYKQRREEIISEFTKIKEEEAKKESDAFAAKAKEAGVILARDIPGWNNDMYQQLMMYAVENGADATEISQTIDPMVFKMLHKAMQFDKGKQVVKAKVKRIGSPKKVAKSTASTAPAKKASNPGKSAFLRKIESGNVTEKDLSNSFLFLED